MTIVYLAGPMSNRPYCNFPAFFKWEEELVRRGYKVWSPAKNDMSKYGSFYLQCPNGTREEMNRAGVEKLTYRTALKDDLTFILDHAEAIARLPDWEASKGAVVEHSLAVCLGLEIILLGAPGPC